MLSSILPHNDGWVKATSIPDKEIEVLLRCGEASLFLYLATKCDSNLIIENKSIRNMSKEIKKDRRVISKGLRILKENLFIDIQEDIMINPYCMVKTWDERKQNKLIRQWERRKNV